MGQNHNELALSLIKLATVKSLNCKFWCVSGSLLFFHQTTNIKESGAEANEDIGDSQEQFTKIE